MNHTRILTATTIALAVALTATGSAVAAHSSPSLEGAPPTRPPATDFTARVDNPWYPLRPGTRYLYRGTKDGQPSRDVLAVTHETRVIDGVTCVVVRDRLYLRGRLGERTTDYYTQDSRGNVWYFGEDTAELDRNGHVRSTSGTWMAGLDGAQPGIYMPAHPRIGQSGRQEYYKGQAEDHFKVIGLFHTVTRPRTTNTLLTKEWTPLEPGIIDHKLYVRGIGTVLEQTEQGGSERAELISVTTNA
ncbi:MAG TPA: hypothetical protein VFD90_21785 [Gaiellales bacterium]|nr:hypothetical protein [Gaiellales bacterium]